MPCVSLHFRTYVRKLMLPILWYISLCRPIRKLHFLPWVWIINDPLTFLWRRKMKISAIYYSRISERELLFGRFSGFAYLIFWSCVSESMKHWWKGTDWGKPKHWNTTCSVDTLSTTNITQSALETKLISAVSGRRLTAWTWQALAAQYTWYLFRTAR
jgi:hypothetical protein